MIKRAVLICVMLAAGQVSAKELHVSTSGDDRNDGTATRPFRTISAAARLAEPGDVVTVHQGVYRERVSPPRGGESDSRRIVYQAAPGERVEIKGSEPVTSWVRVKGDVWKATLPDTFFGQFNPYADLIRGDWFEPKGREHHTGAVYLNGEWLTEAARLDDVLRGAGTVPLWFGRVDKENTTLWAQFRDVENPNTEAGVDINVRRTVFYPDHPGVDYITLRGFILRDAATPWAPPTAEQIGVVGTHWSKGWIIENNVVSHSTCSGIALGKYGDEWDNTSANTAEGYVKTIERALKNGWNRETIGHHIVRNNTISHCEQAGIVGSLGAAFSVVTGNTIHDIHVRKLFTGAEMAGIKFHAAIDTTIRGNHIFRTTRGLWLDWMAQGTRVSGNLFHDNDTEDLFVEVNHGPFLVDNNLFLSRVSLLDWSEGGAYAHNLFAGKIVSHPELNRSTPYHPAHTTEVAGLINIQGGDDRFYNNIFVGGKGGAGDREKDSGYGLWVYDKREFPLQTGGNVYCNGARGSTGEGRSVDRPDWDPAIQVAAYPYLGRIELLLTVDEALRAADTVLVDSALLGKARIPGLPYENTDGTPLKVDADFLGRRRTSSRPTPGPFETPGAGRVKLQVWPVVGATPF